MHASSFENMQHCLDLVMPLLSSTLVEPPCVLEVGSHDVNGSYRELFHEPFDYVGVDTAMGPNVDVVLDDPYRLPFPDRSFDLVVSGQMMEHCAFFWRSFDEMVRVLRPTGFLLLIAPSAGPIHRYPVDCYRFHPDAYAALAERAGIDLLFAERDERGPWRDLVGIFSRVPRVLPPRPVRRHRPATPHTASADPAAEARRGTKSYLDVLRSIHAALDPRQYLEIGVRSGDSLRLARARAIGVDPVPQLGGGQCAADVYAETSDDFFRYDAEVALTEVVDLAFIDGMHLFENVLRDFMHVEQRCDRGSLVVIDDVFPNHALQGARTRSTRVWCGDVWKIVDCLRRYRPDLSLTLVDSEPSGLLLVSGVDPRNRVLWENYNVIVREYLSEQHTTPPPTVLDRVDATHPDSLALRSRLAGLKATRDARSQLATQSTCPTLSVVVVAFNMARELPRTLRSLSPQMQREIDADDYEIIVVDNGSRPPFDPTLLESFGARVRVLKVEGPTQSPSRAVNLGLAAARGEICGVMIDGARMASPGLLAGAVAACGVHPRCIVATLAFHLGPDVQMRSIHDGYDQAAEDALLESVDWRSDGYRLFDISVLAGSSEAGWLTPPAESNALFMRAELWHELEGYDERFTSPGGGLVNHDTLIRACDLPGTRLAMLLGEGTFHQIHGGVATNAWESPSEAFAAEYELLRGRQCTPPDVAPFIVGHVPSQILRTLSASITEA